MPSSSATTVANGAARRHANSHRGDLDGIRAGASNLRMAANSDENTPEYRNLVREALRRSGLSQKAFAIDAGQPESVISDGLAGRRAFDVQWIWRQTDGVFRRTLRALEDEAAGSDPTQARQESFDDFMEIARRFWFRHQRREERPA